MWNADAIDIDKGQIIQLLQMKMARVIQDIAARVVVYAVKKTLKGDAIMQVFTGVDFVAQIHPAHQSGPALAASGGPVQQMPL
jgi:hypothetical protein